MAENDWGGSRTPRWVKVFGVIGVVLLALVVVMLVAGRGGHGPGRHMQSGDVELPPSAHAQP